MLLFRDEELVDRWCEARELPRGAVLTPELAWRLAHAWYKNKVQPDYRRFTLEEAESLLASLGLTDPYWNLRG